MQKERLFLISRQAFLKTKDMGLVGVSLGVGIQVTVA
jgi:hypothetical protein|tara:strand:- start:317 stop:427 length:111 start_codon:yes stop_codon:yes gene_type:complete